MGLGAEISNDRIRSLRIGDVERRGRPMTEVLTPLPISTPPGLVIQERGQSSTEDKQSSHRRREAGLDGESLDSRHAVS